MLLMAPPCGAAGWESSLTADREFRSKKGFLSSHKSLMQMFIVASFIVALNWE